MNGVKILIAGCLSLKFQLTLFITMLLVPQAGRYALAACIVTVGQEQNIQVSANCKDCVKIDIPYTRGMWETTKPVEVYLVQEKNKLSFTGPFRSMALKDFTLTPIR